MHNKLFRLSFLWLVACGSPYVPPSGPIQLPSDQDMSPAVSDAGLQDMQVDVQEMSPPTDTSVMESKDTSQDMEPPDPGGAPPTILEFSTNITTIVPSSQLIFSVIVTDPDGIEDLIGGNLRTPEGQSFGAFATAASEGSYQIMLTWDAVAAVRAIEYSEPSGMTQTFIAEFYDQGGARTQARLNLTFTCAGEFERACEPNDCVDIRASTGHCGRCDAPLPSDANEHWIFCADGQIACTDKARSSALVLWCEDEDLCPVSDTACVWCDNSCDEIASQLFGNYTVEDTSCLPNRSTACNFVVTTTARTSCDQVCASLACEGANAEYAFSPQNLGCQETPEPFGAGNYVRIQCHCRQPIN